MGEERWPTWWVQGNTQALPGSGGAGPGPYALLKRGVVIRRLPAEELFVARPPGIVIHRPFGWIMNGLSALWQDNCSLAGMGNALP